MLFIALLRLSRKHFHNLDPLEHNLDLTDLTIEARGCGEGRRREEADAHATIDILVECHRLDIFISEREIRFCASTPGLPTSAPLYIATEAGGMSECF